MAKRKATLFERTEQPIFWGRAFLSGVIGSIVMMGFIDNFFMLGITPFTYEQYLGSLLRGTIYGHANWIVGFLANLLMGGLFGFVYAWAFEYVFKRAGTRNGVYVGLFHSIIAAVAVFPFFNIIMAQMNLGLYPGFGFFGVGLGAPTPILLLMGHFLFGAAVGLFYGPVRAFRVRARAWEPGEMGMPGELDVTPESEDERDSKLVYRVGG
jgi:hypothetical protein